MNAAGYLRVSTREQGDGGLSLQAQREQLAGEAARRDWQLAALVPEVKSGSDMRRRPELTRLLEQLDDGAYGALLVTRLDRLTRSLMDFAGIMDRAHRHGWALVIIDSDVDMTTPWGRAMAGMGAVWAQLQRELIAQNTRDALAVARARGTFNPGQNRYTDEHVIRRIKQLSSRGNGSKRIARTLELEGHPGPAGGAWHARTVSRILQRERSK